MDTLRIGLIGAGGNMRRRHIPGFRALDDLEIVAVANRSRESGERVAKEFAIPRVAASVDDLLADPAIDAVCIGTWPDKHREYTIAALDAGKHVLCEARMAMDAPQAEQMRAAAAEHSRLVAQLVPSPLDLRLGPTIRRMITDGELGDVLEVHVRVLDGDALDRRKPVHWRHRQDLAGHNTLSLGIYNETIQRWLGDTERVVAHARVFVDRRRDPASGNELPLEIPDSLTVAADLICGTRAAYQLSAVTHGYGESADETPTVGEISVYGSAATLHWRSVEAAEWAPHGGALRPLHPDPGTDRGWRVEADFVDSIRHGTPVQLTNFADGVRYMRFTDAVWQSWNEGRPVEIQPLSEP